MCEARFALRFPFTPSQLLGLRTSLLQHAPPAGATIYKKKDTPDEFFRAGPAAAGSARPGAETREPAGRSGGGPASSSSSVVPMAALQETRRAETSGQGRKRAHYVNLLSKEGADRIADILPGRHLCYCQATKHRLVNNCLGCGKVVCSQEGAGPCLFCRTLVCTREQQEVLQRRSKKSHKLVRDLLGDASTRSLSEADLEALIDQALPQSAEAAKAQADALKERLLEYDRTSAQRTRVIDDESDYFATDSNQWLTEDERRLIEQREAQARAKRELARKRRTVTIDFAGRQGGIKQGRGEGERGVGRNGG